MNLVHARIVEIFKKGGYEGKIGIVHALQTVYPITNAEEDEHAALLQDALDNSFYLDGTLLGKYSHEVLSLVREIIEKNGQEMIEIKAEDERLLEKAAQEMDFVGMNYYFSKFMRGYEGKSETFHNGTGEKGSSVSRLQGVGEEVHRKDIPSTDWDWPIYPKGMFDQLSRIKNHYKWDKEVYITENGMGCKDKFLKDEQTVEDDERIDYLKKHMEEVAKAIEAGVNVRGYFVWSLAIPSVTDSFMLTLKLKRDIQKRAHTGIRKSVKPRRFRIIIKKTAARFSCGCFFILIFHKRTYELILKNAFVP